MSGTRSEVRTDLLTDLEIKRSSLIGVPDSQTPAAELYTVVSDGAIELSAKGLQFYASACRFNRVSLPLTTILSKHAYDELYITLLDAAHERNAPRMLELVGRLGQDPGNPEVMAMLEEWYNV